MNDNFGDEVGEDIFHEVRGHNKGGPVVSVFEYIEEIACK